MNFRIAASLHFTTYAYTVETEESADKWSINSLFPVLTDQAIAEKASVFFNTISSEFTPLTAPEPVDFS